MRDRRPPTGRMRRVNESLREVLSDALPDLQDPRIGFVTLTEVWTSPDLRHATVYVSVLGSAAKRARALEGLEASRGVLQARINQELRLKRTPQLAFEYDRSIDRGVRLSKLLDDLSSDRDGDGAARDR
jgi:ribosome-binding factor A